MALTYDFCDTRAREAAAAADKATLDNVRNAALRSEDAWRKMANRLKAFDIERKAIKQRQSDARLEDK